MSLKRIVVTGANKGIGKALVQKILTDYPDTYVFLGSRDTGKGNDAVANILGEIGSSFASRLEMLQIDVSNDDSVVAAAALLTEKLGSSPPPLYGIVNNAGIGFGYTVEETLKTNLYGPRRVCMAMLPLIDPTCGRIVNIASASGPMYVAKLGAMDQQFFTSPDTSWDELEQLMTATAADPTSNSDAYGFSKACLNVLTMQLARENPGIKVNACTPGFIATDITKGMGATNSPEQGTVAPLHCLFGELPGKGTGWYYGSDAVRSPLDRYRGPGDAPYEGP